MKINVVIPTHESVPALFAYDLAQLSAFTVAAMPDHVSFGVTMQTGTYIHKARQDLMEMGLNQDDDYLLWLDSDMRFPRDSLIRLLKHQLPLVGINYAKREIPTWYVAIKKLTMDIEKEGHSVRLETTEESTGLEEVDAIGFGMVLMRMRDFRVMPSAPWFRQEWVPALDQWMGEDVGFCKLIRDELGHKIYVDQDLSKECGHIGQFTYKTWHADEQGKEEE